MLPIQSTEVPVAVFGLEMVKLRSVPPLNEPSIVVRSAPLSLMTTELVPVPVMARAAPLGLMRIVQLLREGVQCNCELVGALDMAPNLISHHLRILRETGLVTVERDADDARWVYYALDRLALAELMAILGAFFDPARIKERHPACGPQSSVIRIDELDLSL